MAKQTPLLIKTFAADTAISSANVCVLMSGTNAGNVKLPGAGETTKFVGVVTEPAAGVSNGVAVQVAGIAQIQSDGSAVINAGDYVAINDTGGRIAPVTPGFGGATVKEIVGIALSGASNTVGLLVDVLLQPMLHRP
jgi:hypothetical protein